MRVAGRVARAFGVFVMLIRVYAALFRSLSGRVAGIEIDAGWLVERACAGIVVNGVGS